MNTNIKNNGKNTDRQLKKLIKDRLVNAKKQGRTYSMNHNYKNTIEDRLIQRGVPTLILYTIIHNLYLSDRHILDPNETNHSV
ncbi:MAG: hypothetical protein COA77_07215 [Thaumarchaeota archaeon]|nr:MAG: hypothetical protein COA77_07215 [Nitrososphaerota archaeon]